MRPPVVSPRASLPVLRVAPDGKWLEPRSPQRYCSERRRRASEKAMREWARDQLAAGGVTLAELQRLPVQQAPAHVPTELPPPGVATPCDAGTGR